MTNLIPFTYGNAQVRVLTINEAPWWVAVDVCAPLGLSNVSQALAGLDDDEKSSVTINDGTPGSPIRAIISEAGLYSLILRSRKPEAKAFKRWVTHEVLPAIRKSADYINAQPGPALTIGDDERGRSDSKCASRTGGRSYRADREGDRPRPGTVCRGHGGGAHDPQVRDCRRDGRRGTSGPDRDRRWRIPGAAVSTADRVVNVCQAVGLTPSTCPSRLPLDIKGQENTGALNRQIVRPGDTTQSAHRLYGAALTTATTRSAA